MSAGSLQIAGETLVAVHLLLVAGALALRLCRSPHDRHRIAELTLGGVLLATALLWIPMPRPVAAWFAAGSVPLALLSAWLLANRIDADAFIGILGALLLVLAVVVITGRHRHRAGGPELEPRPDRLVPAGAVVGITSGTFAVGGGLVTVPLLERVQHMVAHRATATTSATAWASSLAGSVGHSIAGNVEWDTAGVLAGAAMVGSLAGARVAGRLAPGAGRALVAVGLVAAGVPLVVDALA